MEIQLFRSKPYALNPTFSYILLLLKGNLHCRGDITFPIETHVIDRSVALQSPHGTVIYLVASDIQRQSRSTARTKQEIQHWHANAMTPTIRFDLYRPKSTVNRAHFVQPAGEGTARGTYKPGGRSGRAGRPLALPRVIAAVRTYSPSIATCWLRSDRTARQRVSQGDHACRCCGHGLMHGTAPTPKTLTTRLRPVPVCRSRTRPWLSLFFFGTHKVPRVTGLRCLTDFGHLRWFRSR